jgi:hypothetical protein
LPEPVPTPTPTPTPTLPVPTYVCETAPQTAASIVVLRGITTDPGAVSARFVLSPPQAVVGVNEQSNTQGRVRVFVAAASGLVPGTSYTVTVEFLDGIGRVLGSAVGCGFETPIDVQVSTLSHD